MFEREVNVILIVLYTVQIEQLMELYQVLTITCNCLNGKYIWDNTMFRPKLMSNCSKCVVGVRTVIWDEQNHPVLFPFFGTIYFRSKKSKFLLGEKNLSNHSLKSFCHIFLGQIFLWSEKIGPKNTNLL